jgi:hypothetical protein
MVVDAICGANWEPLDIARRNAVLRAMQPSSEGFFLFEFGNWKRRFCARVSPV